MTYLNRQGKIARPVKMTVAAKNAACRVYAKTGNRVAAADAAGVTLKTLENYMSPRTGDPAFREAMLHAKAQHNLKLEKEAERRAVRGVTSKKPLTGGGILKTTKYSDKLLQHLLKVGDREKHGDKVEVKSDTTVRGGVDLDLSKLSQEERDKLRELLEAATSDEDDEAEGK